MTDARHFEQVSLRHGMGWVRRGDGVVARPPDGETFSVAAGGDDRCVLFHLVEAKECVAVMSPALEAKLGWEIQRELASDLMRAGVPVVVWIQYEAAGAALVHAYSADQDAIEYAACAVWALKTIGGWDETPLMTFEVAHVRDLQRVEGGLHLRSWGAAWVTARGRFVSGSWSVDVCRLRPGGWQTLNDDVAALAKAGAVTVLLADVDWLGAYGDSYGPYEADLMLARVHACIEAIALEQGVRCVRVGGGHFAIALPQPNAVAHRVAEAIRQGVEAMNIPFQHGEVRTHGRVTSSVAAVTPVAGADLRAMLADSVLAAKRAGRNRVGG